MSSFLKKLRSKKGLTGADVASAITVILLTIGVVTAIYVNAINKSKDNLRYANAVRIATNIIENIQANPYDCVINADKFEVDGNNDNSNNKIFDTRIPSGFSATVTLSSAKEPDIVRDVTVNVKYKSSMTYKTITLKTVKEREQIDLCNSPDFSLLKKEIGNKDDIYPVIPTGTKYQITTTDDISWYNYEVSPKKFAYVLVTQNAKLGYGSEETASSDNVYIWVPRYVKNKGSVTADNPKIQYLYGTSDYKIVFNNTGTLKYYGIALGSDKKPVSYDTNLYGGVASEFEGKSGIWIKASEMSGNTLLNNLN